jgi:glycosyltransferase involved in cell wall biosynthesis
MKILIVLPTDSLGGAENYLKMMALHYKNEEVDVYAFKNESNHQWDDLKQYSNLQFLSKSHVFIGVIKFCFLMLLRRKKYDYIFTSQVYVNGLVGILKLLGVIKSKYFVARESTSIFLRFKGKKLKCYRAVINLGYRNMDLLVCQTKEMKQQFIHHFDKIEQRTKICVIPNPIDLEVSNKLSKSVLDFDISLEYIVSAGRFIPLKGYDVLIASFYNLKKKYPNLKLILLGEGELLQDYKMQVENLELEDSVIFPGFTNNVYPYFKHATVCVVSSRIEGFPNVLLQMMSQNTKVVSTTCTETIKEIKGVFTCKADNEVSLTNAINKCLKTNTIVNRNMFDNYLNVRTTASFMKIVDANLNV